MATLTQAGLPKGTSRIIARAVKSDGVTLLISHGGARIRLTGQPEILSALAAKVTRKGNMTVRVSDAHGEHLDMVPARVFPAPTLSESYR